MSSTMKIDGKSYYKTKKATGTSASKAFKLGVNSASGLYINPDTGHTYKETKRDKKTGKVTLKYLKTVILKVPDKSVTGLKLTRDGNGSRVLRGEWKVPDALTSKTNCARGGGYIETWTLDTSTTRSKKDIIDKDKEKGASDTSCTENLADFTDRKKRKYTRASFYPFAGMPYLYSVSLSVLPYNSKGKAASKLASKQTFTFLPPRAPTISALAFDPATGVVSCTITTDPGNDQYERYDTEHECYITDQQANRSWYHVKTASTATSISISYNASNYQLLPDGKFIAVQVRARSRGFAGASAWVGWRTYYISRPKPPSLEKPSAVGALVPCKVTLNQPAGFPVDGVKLEMLKNVTYKTAAAIPKGANWAETGAVDDGACTGLTVQLETLKPETKGRRTWLRVKAWHGGELDALTTYSNVVEAPVYEAEAAEDNFCTITSASHANDDGTSATVVVAWDKTSYAGDDDTTSMILSWSDDADAWKSTEPPESYEFDWTDASPDASASGWGCTATVKVKGLEPETKYYFRARCVVEEDESTSYGEWCAPLAVTTASLSASTASEPSAVLSAPTMVAAGEGIPLTWVVAAPSAQTKWELFNDSTTSIAGADGAGTAYTVPAETVAAKAVDGVFECALRAYVGGGAVESAPVSVRIAERPSLGLSASTLTAQPFAFEAVTDVPGASLSYAVTMEAGTGNEPDGSIAQVEGDTVAAATVTPEWALAADGSYKAVVQLPANRAFYDGGGYAVAATVTDPTTGLASERAEARFSVKWGHQAIAPPTGEFFKTADTSPAEGKAYYTYDAEADEYSEVEEPDASGMAGYYEFDEGVAVDAEVTEDGEGRVTRSATITLEAPAGAAATDVYDVYRVTHDGAQLVGTGYALDEVVTDQFATFGDAGDYAYRVCLRTVDGDQAWMDYDYYLDGGCIRLDWGDGEWAELPYDIDVGDGYEKDAEVRRHLDGGREAYYDGGSARKVSLATNIIRIDDAETATALRSAAQHAGNVYVRTPDGSAFEAMLDVSGLDTSGPVLAASIDAERVGNSGAYDLPRPKEAEE